MRIRFPYKVRNFRKVADDQVIILRIMGDQAVSAVFDTLLRVAEIPPAAFPKGIQRTVTEQAIKPFRIRSCVAGEKFTFPIAEKFIMFHAQNPDRFFLKLPDASRAGSKVIIPERKFPVRSTKLQAKIK